MLILLCDEQKYCIILPMTRLPSNLTLTSHECMHLVMRGHFRSRDKDDGHTIRSATAKNHLLHANFMARCFIELQLLQTEVIHCRNRDFGPFLARWPSYTNLTHIPWRQTECVKMSSLCQGFWQLSPQASAGMGKRGQVDPENIVKCFVH